MPQQSVDGGKVSIADFVAGVRQHVDIPADMKDEDVARQIFEADPSLMKGVQTSEPRRPMKQPQSGVLDRGLSGFAAVPNAAVSAPFKRDTYKGIGQNITKQLMSMVGSESTRKQITDKMSQESKAAGGAGSFVDAPAIKHDWQNGNKAGAVGRGAFQALTVGSMAKGMIPKMGGGASTMGEMEAIGEATSKDAYMNIAKTMTKPHAALLDEQIGNIEKAMDNQYIDSRKLSADTAYAANVMKKLKNVPEAQLSKVNAAKDAVAQVQAKIKANPRLIAWKDGRGLLKQIKSAEGSMPPGTARDALKEVRQGLEDRLQTTANAAGQGDAYSKWVKDYRKMSNLQRAGARIMQSKTAPQVETKLTAKEAPTVRALGSKIQFGSSRAGKIANMNKQMLGKWHKSLDELDKQIKTAPTSSKAVKAGGAVESDAEEARRGARPQANSTPIVNKPPDDDF
jgi:hypothetical protein